MTREQAEALLAVVDAKIQRHAARDSSDGGLWESLRESELEKEFLDSLEPTEPVDPLNDAHYMEK